MSIVHPEIEIVDRASESILYLEHGWPSSLCRWHAHDEYELHLLTAMRGKAFVGDYIGDFDAGSLFLTGPNLPHNWITDSVASQTVDIRDMLIQFDQRNLDRLAEAFPEFTELSSMFELARSGIEFIGLDGDEAAERLRGIRDARGTRRVIAFLELMTWLNEHPTKKALSVATVRQPTGNRKQARIAEVVDYITKNFADEITLESAAAMAGMSPTTFSRNFQIATGNRFVEFINRVRIGQACSMLYATEEQVSSICFEVGFQNLANFNRHFQKMKNMTPSAYRNLARSELAQIGGERA